MLERGCAAGLLFFGFSFSVRFFLVLAWSWNQLLDGGGVVVGFVRVGRRFALFLGLLL